MAPVSWSAVTHGHFLRPEDGMEDPEETHQAQTALNLFLRGLSCWMYQTRSHVIWTRGHQPLPPLRAGGWGLRAGRLLPSGVRNTLKLWAKRTSENYGGSSILH